MEIYYHQRKGPRGKAKPFEAIQNDLREDFLDLEFKVLKNIKFELEFDLPWTYVKDFTRRFNDYCI